MDLMAILKIVAMIIVAFFLYSIASVPGLEGKAFVMIILAVGFWYFILREQQKAIINPVVAYYQRIARACELKGALGLRFLVFSGDANNQKYIKGQILGGPLILTDQTRMIDAKTKKWKWKYPEGHPWHKRYVFLYTPSYGDIYKIPLIGSVLASMRKKCLITIWPAQLRSKSMVGDVEVKGINTQIVEQMEYVSDELFDYDAEMSHLSGSVDRITLADNLAMLPTRIRSAVDSNSEHLRILDTKDFPVNVASQ
jgi:hypothetical protein